MQEKRIQFYDSMGGDGMYYLKGLLRYVQDEHQAKRGSPLPDVDSWKLVPCTSDTPRQLNCKSNQSDGPKLYPLTLLETQVSIAACSLACLPTFFPKDAPWSLISP